MANAPDATDRHTGPGGVRRWQGMGTEPPQPPCWGVRGADLG